MVNSLIGSKENTADPVKPGLSLNVDDLDLANGQIDLNKLTQKVFEFRKECLDKLGAIIRCDNLPTTTGDAQQYAALFNTLVGLILENPPLASKLFIYIKCAELKEDLIGPTESKESTHYEICFFTNYGCKELNNETFVEELNRCYEICKVNNATLECHELADSGCLFTLKLWGQIN